MVSAPALDGRSINDAPTRRKVVDAFMPGTTITLSILFITILPFVSVMSVIICEFMPGYAQTGRD